MLIFDSRRGRFGTQKPKQWGSGSSVESAVRKNAEQLGFDPSKILAIFPMWEGGGAPRDIISGAAVTVYGNPTWQHDGMSFTGSGQYLETALPNGAGNSDHSVSVFICYRNTLAFGGAGIFPTFWSWGGNYQDSLYVRDTDAEFWSLFAAGARTDRSDISRTCLEDGKTHTISASWDADIDKDLTAIDGNQIETTTRRNTTVFSNSLSDKFELGSRSGDSINDYCRGVLPIVIVYDGYWTAEQTAILHEAPYLLLQPVTPTFYLIPSGTGTSGTITAGSVTVTPTIVAGVLTSVQVGNVSSSSVIVQPELTSGALSSTQTGNVDAGSVTIESSINAAILSAVQNGNYSAGSITLTPTINAGVLSAVQVGTILNGNITAGQVTITPTINTAVLSSVQVGAILNGVIDSGQVVIEPTINPATITSVQVGNISTGQVSVIPTINAAVLSAVQVGGTLNGTINAAKVAITPIVFSGSLLGVFVLDVTTVPTSNLLTFDTSTPLLTFSIDVRLLTFDV